MVYLAAGVSGFTGIIESFFVKDQLGLSAAFLASLGFWAGLPWALKMPIGHLVDLFWERKSFFVYFGALLMAAGLLIMVGLTGHKEWMAAILPPEIWYVLSALISPVGFVFQDVVADAMTVEAVPRHDASGRPTSRRTSSSACTPPCRRWGGSPSSAVRPWSPGSAGGWPRRCPTR